MKPAKKWLYLAAIIGIPSLVLEFLFSVGFDNPFLMLFMLSVGISLGIDYERREGVWFGVVKK